MYVINLTSFPLRLCKEDYFGMHVDGYTKIYLISPQMINTFISSFVLLLLQTVLA